MEAGEREGSASVTYEGLDDASYGMVTTAASCLPSPTRSPLVPASTVRARMGARTKAAPESANAARSSVTECDVVAVVSPTENRARHGVSVNSIEFERRETPIIAICTAELFVPAVHTETQPFLEERE